MAAGYAENEISRLDKDLEAGLLSMTVRALRKVKVLSGRRNHVAHIMRANPGMSRIEAIKVAQKDLEDSGGFLGRVGDYVDYYYPKYG